MAETVHSCDEYCVEHHEKVDDSPVGKLLRGAIDSHLHFSPDSMPRRYNALESALKAQEAGLRGIVIKNHTYPTAPLARLVGELVPDVAVVGGVCLFIAAMLKCGLSEEDITYMVKINPARIIRLPPEE